MDPEAVVQAQREAARLLRVLLVEDERELGEMLTRLLQTEGFTVDLAEDGQTALHLGLTRPYQLLLIDRGLPVIEGLDLLGRLRARGVTARALVLTARGSVGDRVAGLDAGADDYLTKPFAVEELLARLRALLRRHEDAADGLHLGDRSLDLDSRTVCSGAGVPVELTEREAALLTTLARRPDRTFTAGSCSTQARAFTHGSPSARWSGRWPSPTPRPPDCCWPSPSWPSRCSPWPAWHPGLLPPADWHYRSPST